MGLRTIYRKIAGVGVVSLVTGLAGVPPVHHQAKGNLSPVPAAPDTRTDAVVVFTGSFGRISHGYNIYARGLAEKFMVSGVDPASRGSGFDPTLFSLRHDPHVHIDYAAENTIQNARNTAAWAIHENIKSVRLVTSDFHMPRAYFELRRLLPSSVFLYADPLSGEPRAKGMNSEETRLTCRVYETTLGINFCYGARRALRTLGLL